MLDILLQTFADLRELSGAESVRGRPARELALHGRADRRAGGRGAPRPVLRRRGAGAGMLARSWSARWSGASPRTCRSSTSLARRRVEAAKKAGRRVGRVRGRGQGRARKDEVRPWTPPAAPATCRVPSSRSRHNCWPPPRRSPPRRTRCSAILCGLVDDVERGDPRAAGDLPGGHHSPSSAFMVRRLASRPPHVIFLEGCEDLTPALEGLRDCRLPVAFQAFAAESNAFPRHGCR